MTKAFSRYHVVIVALYTLVCFYFFSYVEGARDLFTVSSTDASLFVLVSVLCITSLYFVNRVVGFRTVALQRKSAQEASLLFLYASILISLPEEIVFRGIIQPVLITHTNPVIGIALAACVFGMAHVLNDASGYAPRNWNWKLVIMSGTAGLFLGVLFFLTESLVMPIILHTILVLLMKLCSTTFTY